MHNNLKATKLHYHSVVVDAHCDTLLDIAAGKRELGRLAVEGHADLPRLKTGGVKVQFFAAFIEPQFKPVGALKRALTLINCLYREVSANQSQLGLVRSYKDLESLVTAGKIAAILSVEGGEVLEGEPAILEILYHLGVRSIGLTWNQRNQLADGVEESQTGGGLTKLGVQVVNDMNNLGILIDVSHLSESSFWDVLKHSKQPVIASHSNCRGLCEHPRNLTDKQIKELAQQGGVICITFAPQFVTTHGPATLDQVVDHIDYACQLVGSRHVGIGSDFDGIEVTPEGLSDATCFPAITDRLLSRGYSNEDIRCILGANILSVLKTVLKS